MMKVVQLNMLNKNTMENTIPTPEEVQAIAEVLQADTLTPSPVQVPTDEQVQQIKTLLAAGISSRDIFCDYYLPLEWCIEIEAQIQAEKDALEALNNPIDILHP